MDSISPDLDISFLDSRTTHVVQISAVPLSSHLVYIVPGVFLTLFISH